MKKIIATICLIGSSVFGDITPNVPDGMPVWADENDLHVAYVIMGESRGEPLLGQSMVADVVHSRMLQRGLTAYEVVTEPHQFAGYYDGEVTDHVWKLVRKLKLGIDIIPDASFCQFRAYKLTNIPTWAKEPVVVGNHIFFTE